MLGRSACRSPRARRALTSSIKPAASIASKRWAMRVCSQARSVGSSDSRILGGGKLADFGVGDFCVKKRDSGWPEMRYTSSAREMRCESLGASRFAVTQSTFANSACKAGQPIATASDSIAARTCALACGKSSNPSHSAFKYNMVPPTSRASLPRWLMSLINRAASRAKSAAL